jgi:hypothetical protein
MIDVSSLFGISRFTIKKIIDDEEHIIGCTENYVDAKSIFDYTVKHLIYNEEQRIFIVIYDYDKDANIETYDNFEDF